MPHFRLRTYVIAALAVMTLAASACAPARSDADNSDQLVVLTTFTVIADMASNVAGDRARVESVTSIGTEIHGYQPTASDVIRAADADLVLHNGLGLEAWFADFMDQVDAPHVTLTDQITPVTIEGSDAVNPHAWMSPDNAVLYVRAIQAALSNADPDGAGTYRANADAYVAEINHVGSDMRTALAQLPQEARVLVTCEGAFSYLAADVGLDEVYLWPVNSESQSTAGSVRDAIEAVRDRDIPAVFCESTVNADSMVALANEAGTSFGGTLYVDSLSAPDGPVPSYLELLRVNAQTIVTGLRGDSA